MENSKETVAEIYTTKGSDYDHIRLTEPRGVLLSEHDVRLFLEMFHPPKSAQVLEIGAGTGRFTMPVLEKGYSVTATDINSRMLDSLKEKIEQQDLSDLCKCQHESVFELSFADESWDYVFSLHVLPRFLNLEDQTQAISEVGRVLKPGGQFLFNFRNSKSPYRWLHKGHTASTSEIERALQNSGLRVVKVMGKHFSSRTLYNKLPMLANHLISKIDRALRRAWANRAWDVFVLAEKEDK